MRAEFGQGHEVVESENAESGRAFDQQVQQISGGQDIVEGSVTGLVGEAKMRRQRAEFAIGDLVADQTSGQWNGVDDFVVERFALIPDERGVEKPHIETRVVGDDDRVADELRQGAQKRFDTRCGYDHGFGDTRQDRDERGDRTARVDQCLKSTDALAGEIFGGANLGDAAVDVGSAGGFEVDNAKSDLVQRRSRVGRLVGRYFFKRLLHPPSVSEQMFSVKYLRRKNQAKFVK